MPLRQKYICRYLQHILAVGDNYSFLLPYSLKQYIYCETPGFGIQSWRRPIPGGGQG